MAIVEGGRAAPRADVMQDLWPVFVCYNGLATYHPQSRELVDPTISPSEDEIVSHDENGLFLIPSCRTSDRLLGQPPLGIKLTRQEVLVLLDCIENASDAIAVTDYGPDGQDKVSNQDFALACTLRQGSGSAFQFSAIADGVSLGNFWPERAARLAVLIAWKVSNEFAAENKISKEYMEEFQTRLRAALVDGFAEDRALLIRCGNPAPPNWNEELFLKHNARDDLWYKTTLLVALVGPSGGFVLAVGDGGIVVEKETPVGTSRTVLLQTSESVQINTVVSSDIEKLVFQPAANIGIGADTVVRVTCCSDGLDRSITLDPAAQQIGSPSLDVIDTASADLLKEVKAFYATALEEHPDNISLTKITWPPSSAPGSSRAYRRFERVDDARKSEFRRKIHVLYGLDIVEHRDDLFSRKHEITKSDSTPEDRGAHRELIEKLYNHSANLDHGLPDQYSRSRAPNLAHLISLCRFSVHEIMAAEETEANVILGNIERLVWISNDNKINKDWVSYYTISLLILFSLHNSSEKEHRKVMDGLYDNEIYESLNIEIKGALVKNVRNDDRTYRALTKALDLLFSSTLHTLRSGDIEDAFRAR